VPLDIDVKYWLEIAEPPVLNNPKYRDKCIENEEVKLSGHIMMRDKNPEKRVENVSKEFDDLSFSYECELAKKSRKQLIVMPECVPSQ